MCSCFPDAFRLPSFASWPSCSRRRYPLPSRSAYQWLAHRTATGFPCFTLLRSDRCRAPPILRDRGALMADIETSATTAASQRRVLFLRYCLHLPEFWVTKLTGVHFRSPFPVFPLPVTSGWNTGPWAFSRASHPAVASSACQERERALSTRPELTVDQSTLRSSYLTHAVRPHVAPVVGHSR